MFSSIPVDLRVPGTYLTFDATRAGAGLPASQARLILLGHAAIETFTGPAPTAITSAAEADAAFGAGSMLAEMARTALEAARVGELICVPVAEPAGAIATGTVTLSGALLGAGTLDLRIGGRRYAAALAATDTPAIAAGRLAQLVNADPRRAVNAAADGAVLTLTARHPGVAGNAISIAKGRSIGIAPAFGLAVEIAAMAGGAGTPVLEEALAAIADLPAQIIASGFGDGASIAELVPALHERQGPERMVDGVALAVTRGPVADTVDLGESLDSPWLSLVDGAGAPSAPWIIAAAVGAVVTAESAIDPARPLHTLSLAGVVGPDALTGLDAGDRTALLRAGVSTLRTDPQGTLRIERLVTTAKTDGAGAPSTALAGLETVQTLSYLRRAVRDRFIRRFPRHKLADDGTRIAAGQPVVTPATLRAELVALMRELEEAGLVENVDAFRAQLIVERDPVDRDRVNAVLPPDLVNQLRIVAATVQFRG